jgi:hypothetical protein
MDLPAVEIGISTSAYENFPLDAALERISHLSNRAEVLSEARHSLLNPKNVRAMKSFGLNYTVHGLSWTSTWPASTHLCGTPA